MKLYKNSKNEIFAFEVDGSQDHLIEKDMVSITEEKVKEINLQSITWKEIKSTRDFFLKECDWVDLPNTPLKNRPAWLRYRQELRDIPQTYSSPADVVWPNKPT